MKTACNRVIKIPRDQVKAMLINFSRDVMNSCSKEKWRGKTFRIMSHEKITFFAEIKDPEIYKL